MGLFFKKKKKEPSKPNYNRIRFTVAGTEPHIGSIRYDLTEYNSEYNEKGDDGDIIYKYTQKDFQTKLVPNGDGLDVIAGNCLIGNVPADRITEVKDILKKKPDCKVSVIISGGEYKEYVGRKAVKGDEPFTAELLIVWMEG